MPREAEIGPGPSVVLSGYGPVGRAYAERLIGGALPLRLAAVRTSAAEGLPPEPRTGWGPLPPLAETLERTGRRCWPRPCRRPRRCANRPPRTRCRPCAGASMW
ncbi:hypothetical protein [Streptomyces rapamycinicus]|uniref:hypothetical protein n=1 Tax=Streptomyces rapamycinicus TaxID=1226757 RepID=UPI0032D917F2